jgi:hypothetical protein
VDLPDPERPVNQRMKPLSFMVSEGRLGMMVQVPTADRPR